ncbi:MAG: hypothetical protein NDI60_02260 [Elusimicrobiales bacterium]|nr:hypothetical protein [Elusimicrobiales bacterium]
MKKLLLVLALACPCGAAAQEPQEKRLNGLERRVTSVEKRVTRLEGSPPSSREVKASPETAAPLAAVFIKKKQVVGKKIGFMLYLELENVSRRRFYAFNGVLVFRDETGAAIWSKPYAYGEPLLPGEVIEVSLGISSEQTREYLKFLKAKSVTVALEKQEVYGAE